MVKKLSQKHQKEIIALSIFEAVRLRSEMYIGQVQPLKDKLPIIVDGKLIQKEKAWSPGFMHLIIEVLENSIDEAKRMKGKMKNIWIAINLDDNRVTIRDEGQGFHRAYSNNKKTKKNTVRTAFEDLHAGSNFRDTSTNLIGTHGVGAAICNILSEKFEVTTTNKTHTIHYEWEDYKVIKEKKEKKEKSKKSGTEVSFVPSPEIFKGFKWDKELIQTYLSFKTFLNSLDHHLQKLNINGSFIQNGKEEPIEITKNFLPKEKLHIEHKDWGTIVLWEKYDESTSVSFINGSQCTGIHQKIVNDWVNEHLKYNLAHHFYDTFISFNVPSEIMRFADQNKTKYAVSRFEIEEDLEKIFRRKLLRKFKGTQISQGIIQNIEDRLHHDNIKKIKKSQRISKRKISNKYSPASKKRDTLYITEGLAAAGAIKQARDSKTEGVYALKGKIKNAKRLSDLTNNKEILEIMSVLGIVPDEKRKPSYNKIVIATDEDCIDENTCIITKTGNKKIKELTYSDLVLTHDGTYQEIEQIIETVKEEYIEFEINGETFVCSPFHKMIIYRDGKIIEEFAKNIKKSDFFLIKE